MSYLSFLHYTLSFLRHIYLFCVIFIFSNVIFIFSTLYFIFSASYLSFLRHIYLSTSYLSFLMSYLSFLRQIYLFYVIFIFSTSYLSFIHSTSRGPSHLLSNRPMRRDNTTQLRRHFFFTLTIFTLWIYLILVLCTYLNTFGFRRSTTKTFYSHHFRRIGTMGVLL